MSIQAWAYWFPVVSLAIMTFALALATPRMEWKQGAWWRLFVAQAGCIAMATAPTAKWFAVAWTVATLPALTVRFRGAYFYYQMVATILLGISLVNQNEFMAAVGLWMKLGLFPFHAGILSLAKEERMSVALPALCSPIAALGFFGELFHAHPLQHHAEVLAVVGAIYFAALAVLQTDARRLVALAVLSATSSALASSLLAPMHHWTLLAWPTIAMAATGMGAVAWATRVRVGGASGGLAFSLPGLAAFFLLFGLCLSGVPGSLSFTVSDKMFTEVFDHRPGMGGWLLVAWCLLGIGTFRAFVRLFQGTPHLKVEGLDVLGRERLAFLMLASALVLPGLFSIFLTPEGDNHENHQAVLGSHRH